MPELDVLTAPPADVAEPVTARPEVSRPYRAKLGVLAKPLQEVGKFASLSLDILVTAARPPFAWGEFIEQCWFIARVSVVPAMLLTVSFSLIIAQHLGYLLGDIGASDLSGAGIGWGVVIEGAPFATVFVVSGAAGTAICADLGARTIREEIDAMRVMGIDPIQTLLVPRVFAITVCAMLLDALVAVVGITCGYFFTVYVQHVAPGAFGSSITLISGLTDVILSIAQATVFGLVGGLIACYKGTTPKGGPRGVGDAVNATVVYTFMALAFVLLFFNYFGEVVKK